MEEAEKTAPNNPESVCEKIAPWYLLELIKPILADEIIAKFRFDRSGIRITFINGQKFHLTLKEIR